MWSACCRGRHRHRRWPTAITEGWILFLAIHPSAGVLCVSVCFGPGSFGARHSMCLCARTPRTRALSPTLA
uniref:Putative secreted peptide n=1 Tax=Anopheles braziliensis TaxID=58242 RepID=A0A2M3ZVV2_9DIPT